MQVNKNDGIQTLLSAIVGPLIWFAHFSLVYAVQTYLCMTGPNRVQVLYALITFVALGVLTNFAVRDALFMRGHAGQTDTTELLVVMRAALTALAMLAIAWSAFGTAVLPPCAV